MNQPLSGKRGFGIIGGVMRILPLLFLCAASHAAEVALPPAPPPAHFDTESVTNAPLGRAMMDLARIFRASASLWATLASSFSDDG